MGRTSSGHPTELELLILKILWQRAPLPVREIRQALVEQGRDLAHTTVITTLNVMVRKKYLDRTQQANAFLFGPLITREQVSEGMLGDLVQRVFDGSAAAVMLSLFECAQIDSDELKELRQIIDRKRKEQTP
ncbi:MAG: mecI 2 [Planctomycetaceae bacterium]|nr:mecI 2 [Planctomycetaceae bacterium]